MLKMQKLVGLIQEKTVSLSESGNFSIFFSNLQILFNITFYPKICWLLQVYSEFTVPFNFATYLLIDEMDYILKCISNDATFNPNV